MAVYSFSTVRDEDTALLDELKKDFKKNGKNFSNYVVKLIKEDQKACQQKTCSSTN